MELAYPAGDAEALKVVTAALLSGHEIHSQDGAPSISLKLSDGTVLQDSGAAARFIGDREQSLQSATAPWHHMSCCWLLAGGQALVPEAARLQVLQWVEWEAAVLRPALRGLSEQRRAACAELGPAVKGRRWLVGHQATLADVVMFATLTRLSGVSTPAANLSPHDIQLLGPHAPPWSHVLLLCTVVAASTLMNGARCWQ